jgi:hypothetical protein
MRFLKPLAAIAAGSLLASGLAVAAAVSASAADNGPLLTGGNIYLFNSATVNLDNATNANIITSGTGAARPWQTITVDAQCPTGTAQTVSRVRIPQVGVDPINWNEVPFNGQDTTFDTHGRPYNSGKANFMTSTEVVGYVATQPNNTGTLPLTMTCLTAGGAPTGYWQTSLTVNGIDSTLTWSVPAPPALALPATTTTLAASAPSVEAGTAVTFTATVAPAAATGTVQFKDGTTVLGSGPVAAGVAAFSTSALAVGTHPVTAVYSGDANNATSTSAAVSVAVTKTATTTTLAASAPSVEAGTAVDFTATVLPAAATGTVQFVDGTTVLGSGPVATGVAAFSTSALAVGTHSVTAVYSGDATNATSTSAAQSVTVTAVAPRSTTTTLSVSPLAGQPHSSVVFTTTVTASTGAANGTLTYKDGATVLGTSSVTAGVVAAFSTTTLAEGGHSLVAEFAGTAPYIDSASAAVTATYTKTATTTALAASAPSVELGTAVTFTATVAPAAATGAVSFMEGSTTLGTGTLAGGVASLSTSALAIGTHSVTAVYAGDSVYTGSTSGAQAVTVTAVTLDPNTRYVIKVYRDLFNRDPDPEGLATWTRLLNSGTPRVAVADAITSSDEYRAGLITHSYDSYLGRTPDPDGLRFWLQKMADGWTVAQMESGFVGSAEFYSRSGSTDSGWIGAEYADVLGRSAGPIEVDFWLGQLGNGATRNEVALGFLLSSEHLSTVVDGYYHHLLGRGLDGSGQSTWVGILQSGGRDETIIGGIISSDEYFGKV